MGRFTFFPVVLLVSLISVSGCNDGFPKRYPVSGTVHFTDGTPCKTGTVELGMDRSKWTGSGKIERDGSFRITTINNGDGAIPGNHKVVIRQLIVSYVPVVGGHDHGHLVAEKYSNYFTTDLEVEIKPEPNVLKLVIDKKPEVSK